MLHRITLLLLLTALIGPTAEARPDKLAGLSYYQARRARLAAWMKPSSLLILGLAQHEHQPWSNKYFFYLTGIHNQNALLLIYKNADGKARSIICFKKRSAFSERWNGVRPYPDQATARRLGMTGAISLKDVGELLPQLMPLVTTLYYDLRRFPQKLLSSARQPFASLIKTEQAKLEKLSTSSPYGQLVAMRQIKDALELRYLQRTIDITGCALVEAMRSARPKMWEYSLEATIQYIFRRNGADQALAFPSIVGSGPNSCVLHYNSSNRQMQAGELVVLDVGAQYRGYAADVTRTIPVSGKFSKRQRKIYEIVLRAQRAGIAAVKPGATMRDVHRAAQRVIADAGYARYFIHGTSHWLGLDVHDVGRSIPLAPGMVLTVEPGIYIAAEKLGVRIEDDVLVTKTGRRVMTAWIPKEVDAIEKWMSKGGGLGRILREIEKEKLGPDKFK